MLLENYRLKLQLTPCNPLSQTVNAIIEFDDDLSDLLPYINAELGPGVFDPRRPFLRLNSEGRAIVLEPHRVGISKVENQAEAEALFAALRDQVRSIAERRDQIKPSYRSLGQVSALDVYKCLPRTNCGECGVPSCFAFATALARGEADLGDCPILAKPANAARRAELEALLGATAEE